MRTDILTALLLDPFLTFGEAAKQCGATGRTRVELKDRPTGYARRESRGPTAAARVGSQHLPASRPSPRVRA